MRATGRDFAYSAALTETRVMRLACIAALAALAFAAPANAQDYPAGPVRLHRTEFRVHETQVSNGAANANVAVRESGRVLWPLTRRAGFVLTYFYFIRVRYAASAEA